MLHTVDGDARAARPRAAPAFPHLQKGFARCRSSSDSAFPIIADISSRRAQEIVIVAGPDHQRAELARPMVALRGRARLHDRPADKVAIDELAMSAVGSTRAMGQTGKRALAHSGVGGGVRPRGPSPGSARSP